MKRIINGYKAGELLSDILTLPITIFFALAKYAIKSVLKHAKNRKKSNQKNTQASNKTNLKRQ